MSAAAGGVAVGAVVGMAFGVGVTNAVGAGVSLIFAATLAAVAVLGGVALAAVVGCVIQNPAPPVRVAVMPPAIKSNNCLFILIIVTHFLMNSLGKMGVFSNQIPNKHCLLVRTRTGLLTFWEIKKAGLSPAFLLIGGYLIVAMPDKLNVLSR